jgi:hypothetical protein
VHGGGATGRWAAHDLQLRCGGGQGGLDCGDLAEPSLVLGLLESVGEVGVDGFQARYLGWVNPEQGASDAGFSELIMIINLGVLR